MAPGSEPGDADAPGDGPLFAGQGGVQLGLLALAGLCVPWMLLAKPYMKVRRGARARVAGGWAGRGGRAARGGARAPGRPFAAAAAVAAASAAAAAPPARSALPAKWRLRFSSPSVPTAAPAP